MLRNMILVIIEILCLGRVAMPVFGQDISQTITLPQPTDKTATLTLEQLRDGIQQYYSRLRAIEVDYEQTTAVVSSDRIYAGILPRGAHHFAFKGEKRFLSQAFPPRDKSDGSLTTEMTSTFEGDVGKSYFPPEKQGQIMKKKDPFIDSDAYMQALGIALSDKDRSLVSKSDYFLPSALYISECDWKVSPKLEIVDGAECHVLQSKQRQRIWVDPKLGFAMRFRESYQYLDKRPTEEWPLGQRHCFGDYRQVADGIWLPERIEIVAYTPPTSPENLWNRVTLTTTHKVTKAAVNEQVPDSIFKLMFPQGTRVTDTVRNRTFRIGKSNEELDVIVAQGREVVSGSTSNRRGWLILMNVAAIIVLVAIFIYRWWAKRRRAAP